MSVQTRASVVDNVITCGLTCIDVVGNNNILRYCLLAMATSSAGFLLFAPS
jgi:hypothetical protein